MQQIQESVVTSAVTRLCTALVLAALTVLSTAATAVAQPSYDCRAFGSDPFCSGRCPAGWKQMYRISCVAGSKAYCCRVPAAPPCHQRSNAVGYNPSARVNGKCQRCVEWGKSCNPKVMGGPCLKFVWESCGPPIRLN